MQDVSNHLDLTHSGEHSVSTATQWVIFVALVIGHAVGERIHWFLSFLGLGETASVETFFRCLSYFAVAVSGFSAAYVTWEPRIKTWRARRRESRDEPKSGAQ
jgi:threonine/homoserine/homoserine lactone efflux protein